MNNIRYLHLIVGLAALLCGLYASSPLFNPTSPADFAAAITATLLGLVNIQQFSSNPRQRSGLCLGLAVIGSAAILLGALLSLSVLLTDTAGALLPWATGVSVAGVCLLAALTLIGMLPARSPRKQRNTDNEGPREAGTVKWFNTTKGFGFISRDQGEDVFVHFRAIRGDGHRVLEEGQRVEFIVARREKGLQAEDVEPLD